MTKQEARQIYIQKRLQLAVGERNRFDDLMLIQFQKLSLPILYYLHTYLAIDSKKEFATDNIIRFIEFKQPLLQLVVPRVNAKTNHLENILITDELEFQTNIWGIMEPVGGELIDPSQLDMVLVPLLAFDTTGNRVGYGKGFYDKLLGQCRANVLKVGFSYFDPIDKIADSNQFDIPLSYCVTPHRIYEFG
jgi:5-formyltetrahydrofolate cyclo-ligase